MHLSLLKSFDILKSVKVSMNPLRSNMRLTMWSIYLSLPHSPISPPSLLPFLLLPPPPIPPPISPPSPHSLRLQVSLNSGSQIVVREIDSLVKKAWHCDCLCVYWLSVYRSWCLSFCSIEADFLAPALPPPRVTNVCVSEVQVTHLPCK